MSEIQGIAPPETSPEKAIPLPSPPVVPSIPSLSTLRAWAPLYLSKPDALLERLSRILSTPSGVDTFLLLIGYSSLLTSTILSEISLARLHAAVRRIISKTISLPPNTTLIISASAIPTSRTLVAAKRLRALSGLISDFRIFARLWGMLGIYKWAKSVFDPENGKGKDTVLKRIEYAQVLVNMCFQYLENGAYLSSKGVFGWDEKRQNRAWIWSSRFWMAHVVLDFGRLGRELVLRREIGSRIGEGGEATALEESKWRAAWGREMVVNSAWAPLTAHWSVDGGLITDFWVGLCGTVVGVLGMRQRWRGAGMV